MKHPTAHSETTTHAEQNDTYPDRQVFQHGLNALIVQQPDLRAAVVEQVHAQARVNGHALEEPLAGAADEDVVPDVVRVREVLEAGNEPVHERGEQVHRGVDAMLHVREGRGVLYEGFERGGDDPEVGGEVVGLDALHGLGGGGTRIQGAHRRWDSRGGGGYNNVFM